MSKQTRYWALAASTILACSTTAFYATPARAAASPGYYETGITARDHRGGAIDLHHVPPIPVGTRLDLGCHIKASGRTRPSWSIGLYNNGHPLRVRKSTARDVQGIRGVYSIHVNNWEVRVPGHHMLSCRLVIDGFSGQLPRRELFFNATGKAPPQGSRITNIPSAPADSNWTSQPAVSGSSGGSSAPASPPVASPSYYEAGITARRYGGRALDPHYITPLATGSRLDLGCHIKASGRTRPSWSIGLYNNGHPLRVRKSTSPAVRDIRGVYSIRLNNWEVRVPGHHMLSCRLVIDGFSGQLPRRELFFNATGKAPPEGSRITNIPSAPADSNWNSSPAGPPASSPTGQPTRSYTKACKSALAVDLKLQPDQLGSPLWQPEADGVQATHIVLPLRSSMSPGNVVICTYVSAHGDATLTTHLDCPNAQAQGTPNTYRCE